MPDPAAPAPAPDPAAPDSRWATPSWAPPCPVCGVPAAPAPAPCPRCGLPAVSQAATVVARLAATIDEFARERDALVATLRDAARTSPARPPAHVPVVSRVGAATPPPPPVVGPPVAPPPAAPPLAPPPLGPPPGLPPGPPPVPRRRLSPQQVLLGLGALLVVAAAIAFVAVAWTRLGVAFQAAVMATVTAAACGTSALAARRGLRATEEALAAAGAALLVVDLAAAHGLGLFGADRVPLELWAGLSCVAVVLVALALGRATRSTTTWPLVALLAAQPAGWLLLPADLADGAAGVAVLAATALGDVLVLRWLRPALVPLALTLSSLVALPAALLGLLLAWVGSPLDSWLSTALLTTAGAAAVVLLRRVRPAALADPRPAAGLAAAVAAAALAGSLSASGAAGGVATAALGLLLLSVAAPERVAGPLLTALVAAGAVLAGAGASVVEDADRYGVLAALVLAAAVPAVLAALLRPPVRPAATAAAFAAAGLAVLTAREGGLLESPATGLLLAIVGATAFGVAALRAGTAEEFAAAASGAVAGAVAGVVTAEVGAWGQMAIDLVVVGAAAGCYALVTGRRPVAAIAVADLVLAGWIAAAGADIRTPEVYTLPAALGLALFAIPALRSGAASWAAEGPAVAVALLPSALVVVAEPTALRLVGVVTAAAALTVVGALTHRQAPFVLGAGALAAVVLGRLAPYAPLVPRWVTLATAGLVLLVVGATYERRRQQAREAVAWVAQMH